MVVEHHDLDRQLVDGGGGQFEKGHLEAAVAGDRNDGLLRVGELGTDRGREAEAHGAGTAGGQPMEGLVVLVELRGPHLVLADVGGDDRLAFGQFVELVDHLLHAEAALLLVSERELLLVAVELGQPLGGFERADLLVDLGKRGLGVADDHHVGHDHLAAFRGIDVDVDDLGVLAELRGLADDAVVEARADIDQQVALDHRLVGVGGAVHAEHAERKRVGLREDALAEQGGGHRRVEGLGEVHQLLVGAGDHRALAGEDHRALRLGDQRGGFFHGGSVDVEIAGRVVAGEIERRVHVAGEGSLGDVLRDVDQHRAGAAGGGDVVGLAGDPRQGVGVLAEVVVLHHRHGDAENVGFLEGVLAEHPGHGLAAEHDHRDRVHHRGHQAGHGVAGAGAGSHQHGGGPAGGAGVAVGHVDRALFVADQDELHLGLDRFEGVEDGNRGSAGVAEDVFDAEGIEGFDEGLRAVEFVLAHGKNGMWGVNMPAWSFGQCENT